MCSRIPSRFALAVALASAAALLVPADEPLAQSLNIRGAGCIGPCYAIACCGQHIVVNESGVGFGRDFDCQRYADSASPEEKQAFCSVLAEQGATCIDSCPPEQRCPPTGVDCATLEEQRAELIAQQALLEVLGDELRRCEEEMTRLWRRCVELGTPCAKASCPVRQEYSDAADRLGDLYVAWASGPQDVYEECCDPANPCIPPLRVKNPADRSETQKCIADCVENGFSKCMKLAAAACSAATAICLEKRGKGLNSSLRCILVGETCAAAAAYKCAIEGKDCNRKCREQYDDVDGCAGTSAKSAGVLDTSSPGSVVARNEPDGGSRPRGRIRFSALPLALALGPVASLSAGRSDPEPPDSVVSGGAPADTPASAPASPPPEIPVFDRAVPIPETSMGQAAQLRDAMASTEGLPAEALNTHATTIHGLPETATWDEIERFYDEALSPSWRSEPEMRFSRADEAIETLPAWKAWTRESDHRAELLSIHRFGAPGAGVAFLVIRYLVLEVGGGS